MTSLVPYASSEEDESPLDSKQPKKRLSAFQKVEEQPNKAAKVHTSLGVAASRPLKGDWLCYIFVPVNQDGEIGNIMQEATKLLALHCGQVKPVQNPHISVSKPILVRYHEKGHLMKRSKDAICHFNAGRKARFPIAFSAFAHLPGADESRIFWAIEIGLGWQELQSLTLNLNESLATLHARQYFKEARYHSSFASVPHESITKDQIEEISLLLESKFGNRLRSIPAFLVDQVGVTIGSETHLVNLKDGANST